uniref:iron chelate uptake ABC transporter family permease subunit n=2 Tax=Enterobacteriaceae TaxID=543 RepID=UPI00259FE3A2
ARLFLAPLIGALILWLSDQAVIWLTGAWREISTGTVTALIGAPLLLWLLPRLRTVGTPALNAGDNVPAERQHVGWWVLVAGGLLALVIVTAL